MTRMATSLLILLFPVLVTAIDLNSLVKVTPENNPRCVEYYVYQNQTYCSTTAQDKSPPDTQIKDDEKLNIIFDDRPWKMAWGNKDDTVTTVEYVPDGDDINHWHELITSQFFPGLQEKATLKEFADSFMQDLKNNGFQPIVTFHEVTDNRILLEFRIEQPTNQIQDELQMLTKDNQGVYILHYVIKKSDMGQANRDKWLQNLKNSTIKNTTT